MAAENTQEELNNNNNGFFQEITDKVNEIIPTLPREKDLIFPYIFRYQGFWLPDHTLKSILAIQSQLFTPRPSDVFVATTFPKSGTTWLRALTFAVTHRSRFDYASHPVLTATPRDVVPFLARLLLFKNDSEPDIELLPSPRLLATHTPYTFFPKTVTDCGCRFVYIYRDPKDVFVSMWHFTRKVRPKDLPPISLEEAFEMFCRGALQYGPVWEHALGYWRESRSLDNQGKVLFLRYEDLKRDTLSCVQRLAEFLGEPFSMEEVREGVPEEIVKLCSFERLSNLEVNKASGIPGHIIKNGDFFRKGEVGDWQNCLSLEMAQRVDRIMTQKLMGTEFSF